MDASIVESISDSFHGNHASGAIDECLRRGARLPSQDPLRFERGMAMHFPVSSAKNSILAREVANYRNHGMIAVC